MKNISFRLNRAKINRQDVLQLFVLFFIISILKSILVFYKIYGPTLFYDEFFYKNFARSLFENFYYTEVSAPPLYPLLLAPAFLFKGHFYEAMLVINILISSSIIFPTWLISRLFFNHRISLLLCVLSAALPFHMVFPRMLMSENLYNPLFLLSAYLVLKDGSGIKYLDAVILGFILSLLLLTRYISVVVIPVFTLLWTIKRFRELGFSLRMLSKELMTLILVALIVYSPWIAYGISNGYSISGIIGLNVSKQSAEIDYDLSKLIMWAVFYFTYLVLMVAPWFVIYLLGMIPFIKEQSFNLYTRFYLLILGLTTALSVASTRHSWMMDYNYPEPLRLNGRYLTYVSVLFIILAFVIIEQYRQKKFKVTNLHAIFMTIFALLTVFISYKILIFRDVWQLPSWFLLYFNAPDSYLYNLGVKYGLIYILTINFLIGVLILMKNRYIFPFMCLAMLFFYGLSNVFFYQKVVSIQSDALHGRNISHVIKNDPDFQKKKLVIYNDIQNKPNKFIDFSLLFWDIDEDEIEVLTYNEINNSNSGYLITKRKLSDPLLTYSVRGEAYGIYHLTNTPQNE